MPKQPELEGEVLRSYGNNLYQVRVELEGNSTEVLCGLSGNMRRFKINVQPCDKVRVVLPPPFNRGRIVYREKN